MNVSKQIVILLVCSVIFFSACKKDNDLTQAQITAAKLQALIGSSNFSSYTVFNFDKGSVEMQGAAASVSGDGFLYITTPGVGGSTVFFNLENLRSYQVAGNSLYLYF